MFRFPSTGKAHSDRNGSLIHRKWFSFDSLQPGRHIQTTTREPLLNYRQGCFDSLQTGRHIQTEDLIPFKYRDTASFDSLQTGRHIQTWSVSHAFGVIVVGFDSLQTGRHIQTDIDGIWGTGTNDLTFRFPSNGKAHSDFLICRS